MIFLRSLVVFVLVFLVDLSCAIWPFTSSNSLDAPTSTSSSSLNSNALIDLDAHQISLVLDSKALDHRSGLVLLEELQTSGDRCLMAAFVGLKTTCHPDHSQTDYEEGGQDEAKGRLAVAWLNCQRRRARWTEFPCSEEMPLHSCTTQMTPDEFTQFNLFYLKVNDVCLALNNDVSRHKIEAAVSDLQKAAQDSASVTKATLKNLLLLHTDFVSSAEEATTRHGKLVEEVSQLGGEAKEGLNLLLAEITGSFAAQQAEAKKIIEEFKIASTSLEANQGAMGTAAQEALATIFGAQQEFLEFLDNVTLKHLNREQEHLRVTQELKQTQEAIVVTQREQVAQAKVIGETTQRVGGLLSLLVRGGELVWSISVSLWAVFRSGLLYLLMTLLGEFFFSPISRRLVSLSRVVFLTGFVFELTFPQFTVLTRMGLVCSVVGLGVLSSLTVFLFKGHKTSSSGKQQQVGTSPLQQKSDGGLIVPYLVDYIAQLRITNGTAPLPDLLATYLSVPPPCYSVGNDEEGEETLVAEDDGEWAEE